MFQQLSGNDTTSFIANVCDIVLKSDFHLGFEVRQLLPKRVLSRLLSTGRRDLATSLTHYMTKLGTTPGFVIQYRSAIRMKKSF